MTNPTKTEAIENFLKYRARADLAALYSPGMEVQVKVGEDGGERIQGDFKGKAWHGYTDGLTTWKPIRIPLKANTDPEYVDSIINFDLDTHAEGIGLTGWNWQQRRSIYVGFDFDAIVGHADVHGKKLGDHELAEVEKVAREIPWVTVRKSTSGSGLHFYVFVNEITTANHNEHAAVARAIIGKMSATTGYDFSSKVDICGHILWIWHRKMIGTDGLTLLKAATEKCDVPSNWRDHINVVNRTRTKTMPKRISDEVDLNAANNDLADTFERLTSQRNNTPLDDDHKKLIGWLDGQMSSHYWDQDHHMLVSHTWHLKQAHIKLDYRGIFETVSEGKDLATPNCFLFPLKKGAWSVRRFSPGCGEHPSWNQDGSGWTTCFLNRTPDLGTASKNNSGVEMPKGGYSFDTAEQAIKAAEQLGVKMGMPEWATKKRARLVEHRDGRLIAELDVDKTFDESRELKGWMKDKTKYVQILGGNLRQPNEYDVHDYDDMIRHIVSENGEDCGWVLKVNTSWVGEPLTHINKALEGSLGLSAREITTIVGTSVTKNWKVVTRPFQPEYPGDRTWNRRAAQLAYKPTEDLDNLQYPTWTMMLNHCGAGLDDEVRGHAWCKENGILSGGDYLKVWVASMLQFPLAPLPYLFFYSREQNTGKSSFHESISELLKRGMARADNALINQNGFNGELANAVLCVVEEVDLSKAKTALTRIKDWTLSRDLPIHPKGEEPYTTPNTTHWVQTANDASYCPVHIGDTRITMIHVPPIDPKLFIAKSRMFEKLKLEAPDFLAEVLNIEIPYSNDRLNLPILNTVEKINTQLANRNELEQFIDQECYPIQGAWIKWDKFFETFQQWLDPNDIAKWTKKFTTLHLPLEFPKGRHFTNGQYCVGNISFVPRVEGTTLKPKMVLDKKGIVRHQEKK